MGRLYVYNKTVSVSLAVSSLCEYSVIPLYNREGFLSVWGEQKNIFVRLQTCLKAEKLCIKLC